jgi:SAM-dependent methyltransferase
MRSQDYVYLHQLEDNFWWFAGMRAITAALLDPICSSERQDWRVLDAGCGTGANLDWLQRYAQNGSVVGMDASVDALNFCRSRANSNLIQGSVTSLPFADNSFDLITSFDVLIYPPGTNADESALREMHRVLRPGGISFTRVAAYEWIYGEHDKATNALRRYSLNAITRKIEAAKFDILRATYANSWLLPAAIARRLILKPIGFDCGSEVKPFSRSLQWVNEPLRKILASEARFLRRPNSKLSFGLSVICIAQKPIH